LRHSNPAVSQRLIDTLSHRVSASKYCSYRLPPAED
jgi:hypothetical protein